MLSHDEIKKRFDLDEDSAAYDAKLIDEVQYLGFAHGKAGEKPGDADYDAAAIDISHTAQILFVPEAKVRSVYEDAWKEGLATRPAEPRMPRIPRKSRRAVRASA